MAIISSSQDPGSVPPSSLRISAKSLGNAALGLIVFLGGFVFFEPAPYEILIIPLLLIWFACGLKLRRGFLPLTFFLLCFICGGAIAATQKANIGDGFFYITVTGFLATTSIFFAAVTATNTTQRLQTIFKAYLWAAIIGSFIALLAYFRLMPSSETFLFGGRARGPFQDPNVFGPFLALPMIYLLRKMLVTPLHKTGFSLLGLCLLLLAIFLAFSRAAWGLSVLSMAMMIILIYVTADKQEVRSKIVLITVGVITALTGLFFAALSIDAVATLFSERAQLLQSYDTARFGRFARYSYGLDWISQAPLGYGFGKFRGTFGEDAHNVYIKAFVVYGWLGGIAYLMLVLTTLGIGLKHLFKRTPWQSYFQCCYIVLLGHVFVGLVVDIDRWRHLYLIYGLVWGMIAAEALLRKQNQRRQAYRQSNRIA